MKLHQVAKVLIIVTIAMYFVDFTAASYAESEDAAPTVQQERFDIYIHKWIAMPNLSGQRIGNPPSQFVHKSTYGRITVAVFLASWCETCQEQMEFIKRLEEKYSKLFTDFVYIFVSDLDADVRAFSEEFKISDSIRIHGDLELLKSFKNPPLPSIYVGDKFGWIGNRYNVISSKEVDQLEKYLKLMTAF